MKAKYARKICAILFLVLAWEAAALIARAASQYAAILVPTWGTVFGEELPGFASFRGGAAPNYVDALIVLGQNSLITIRRVLLGLLLGGVTGVLTGIVIGLRPTLRGMFYPVVRLLCNIPLLALIALFLVWFGGKEKGIVIWPEMVSSWMLSFRARMALMAPSPSAIILSSSGSPVVTGSSGISTSSVTSLQNRRAISATAAEAAAASRKCPT